jgi:4-hydroxy-tetrahydrodipicolinate synthase
MGMHDRPSLGNMISPFGATGEINEEAYRRHIRYMSDAGTGVFVGGPHATEFVNMDPTERRHLWELAVDENKGKGPIYAIPFGPGSTEEMIDKFKMAKEIGFDGAQLYPAAQDGRGADGIFLAEAERYFRDVLEAVEMPMFLCGYHGGEVIDGPNKQVAPEMLRRLVDDYPHIVGVTVGPPNFDITAGTPNVDAVQGFLDAIDGKRPVRMAGALDWFQKLEIGVFGFHSIQQSIAPKLCASMLESYHAGDKTRAKVLSAKIQQLNEIVHTPRYYYPRSIKPILNHLGFDTGIIRKPYLPLSDEVQEEIRRRVDALSDLKEIEGLE